MLTVYQVNLVFSKAHFTLLLCILLTYRNFCFPPGCTVWMAGSAFQPLTAESHFHPDGMTVLFSMFNRRKCVMTWKKKKKKKKSTVARRQLLYFLSFYSQHKTLVPDRLLIWKHLQWTSLSTVIAFNTLFRWGTKQEEFLLVNNIIKQNKTRSDPL